MTDLSNTLDRHTTLITVNRRLSRVLRGEFDRAQLAAGAKVWESPDILPYASWLMRSWNDFVAGVDRSLPALLSAEQDLSLWEQVISHRPPADAEQPLLQSAEAASLVDYLVYIYGIEKVRELYLSDGDVYADFEKVFKLPVDNIEKRWLEFIDTFVAGSAKKEGS